MTHKTIDPIIQQRLDAILLGVSDAFDCRILSKGAHPLSDDTFVVVTPKEDSPLFDEATISLYRHWYQDKDLILNLSINERSLFVRAHHRSSKQSTNKTDIHQTAIEQVAKQFRNFMLKIIREWKEAGIELEKLKKSGWAVTLIEKTFVDDSNPEKTTRDETRVYTHDGQTGVSFTKKGSKIKTLHCVVKPTSDPDIINAEVSLTLQGINQEQLAALLNGLKQFT